MIKQSEKTERYDYFYFTHAIIIGPVPETMPYQEPDQRNSVPTALLNPYEDQDRDPQIIATNEVRHILPRL